MAPARIRFTGDDPRATRADVPRIGLIGRPASPQYEDRQRPRPPSRHPPLRFTQPSWFAQPLASGYSDDRHPTSGWRVRKPQSGPKTSACCGPGACVDDYKPPLIGGLPDCVLQPITHSALLDLAVCFEVAALRYQAGGFQRAVGKLPRSIQAIRFMAGNVSDVAQCHPKNLNPLCVYHVLRPL